MITPTLDRSQCDREGRFRFSIRPPGSTPGWLPCFHADAAIRPVRRARPLVQRMTDNFDFPVPGG
ncbi:MAG: hypothetical protein CMJ18_01195 [Phycisphaeraceae bacterium]|nr:hypothetical protein [Phycisphaeraceae bacterium]